MPWEVWKLAPPTWEAVAGFLAVVAAWRVGRRQLDIQKQQEVITINQLKMQLLEKRAECIKELKALDSIRHVEGRIANENWLRLRSVLQTAILIFPKKSSKRLDAAVDAIWMMNWAQERSEYYSGKRKDSAARFRGQRVSTAGLRRD